MKKAVSVLFAGFVIMSACELMFANDVNVKYKGASQEKKTEQLSKDLNLTQQQKEKVSVILTESSEKVAAERQKLYDVVNGVIFKDKEQKIKQVLTAEQLNKYEAKPIKTNKKIKETQEQSIERMAKELNLTQKQKEKVTAISREASEKTKLETNIFLSAAKTIKADENTKIKAVLTPQQAQKYDANQKKLRGKSPREETSTKAKKESDEREKKIEQLSKALNLTQQQKEKISAITEEDSVRIEAERQKMIRILNDVIYKESGRKTKEILTPEQYKIYKTTFVKYDPNAPKGKKIIKKESEEEYIDRMEKELSLSKEQKEKITAIKKESYERSRAELDKFLTLRRSAILDEDLKIKENLTLEQAQKYDINKQELRDKSLRESTNASKKWMDNMAKDLNLTIEQNEKVLAIIKEFLDRSMEETEKARKGEEAIMTEETQKIKAVLTPEQAQKYELGQSARLRDWYKDMKEPLEQRVKILADELMLMQEQVEKITVIMRDDSRKIEEEDDKLRQEEGVLSEQRHSKIDDVLTQEQQKKNTENLLKYKKESKESGPAQ